VREECLPRDHLLGQLGYGRILDYKILISIGQRRVPDLSTYNGWLVGHRRYQRGTNADGVISMSSQLVVRPLYRCSSAINRIYLRSTLFSWHTLVAGSGAPRCDSNVDETFGCSIQGVGLGHGIAGNGKIGLILLYRLHPC
jgi:hypothetical protein